MHSFKIPLVPTQLNLGFVLFQFGDVALSDVMFLEAVPKVRSYFFKNGLKLSQKGHEFYFIFRFWEINLAIFFHYNQGASTIFIFNFFNFWK